MKQFLFYFPLIMAVADVAAAVCYCILHDWPRAGYWIAAGFLTATTMMMK